VRWRTSSTSTSSGPPESPTRRGLIMTCR
jgi:hypothetical protein